MGRSERVGWCFDVKSQTYKQVAAIKDCCTPPGGHGGAAVYVSVYEGRHTRTLTENPRPRRHHTPHTRILTALAFSGLFASCLPCACTNLAEFATLCYTSHASACVSFSSVCYLSMTRTEISSFTCKYLLGGFGFVAVSWLLFCCCCCWWSGRSHVNSRRKRKRRPRR